VIEVNLRPGGRKRQGGRRKFALSLPKRGGDSRGGRSLDRWVLGSGAVVVLAVGFIAWLYLSVAGQSEELQVRIEAEVTDSARYANLIEQSTALQARRDTVAQRVAVIQEIDGARYVWPHVLDEVARALPDFTWLTSLTQTAAGAEPQFRLEGMAGNTFALTRFLSNLGDSPFVRDVNLISAQLVAQQGQGGVDQQVQQFVVEASYTTPPPELLQMVPLFGPGNGMP